MIDLAPAPGQLSFSDILKDQHAADAPEFGGVTYEPELDRGRLHNIGHRVFSVMQDRRWRTPLVMQQETGLTWSQIRPRLADLRKSRFGRHTVERERVMGGIFRYRLIPAGPNPFTARQP